MHVHRLLRARRFQALAVAAIVAGAVAATVPALAASASTARPARPASAAVPAAVARCATSALRAWVGIPGDGSAGHVAYELELSNISRSACTLHGYPGVSALAPGGAQLGSPAGWAAGDAERTVTLTPGATAHVLLVIADVGAYPSSACAQRPAAELKVYPPNNTAYSLVPLSFEACSKKGPVYMTVRVTVAGAGIPGYSF